MPETFLRIIHRCARRTPHEISHPPPLRILFTTHQFFPHSPLLPGETEDYEFEGIPVRRIGRPEEGLTRPYELNYRNDVMAEKTRKYLREVNPDLVHVMHLQ